MRYRLSSMNGGGPESFISTPGNICLNEMVKKLQFRSIANLDKLNLVKLHYGGLILGASQFVLLKK